MTARDMENAVPVLHITVTTMRMYQDVSFPKEATYDRSIENLARDHGIIK